jgi:hypothetical protein
LSEGDEQFADISSAAVDSGGVHHQEKRFDGYARVREGLFYVLKFTLNLGRKQRTFVFRLH